MKTINNNKLFKITLLILTFSLFVLPLFAKETKFDEVKTSKRFISDVEKITGKLSEEEKAIARFSFRNSFTSLGYNWIGNLDIDKASKELTKEDYKLVVEKAASLTKNPASQGALKLGKAGEKILKALANSTEKAFEAGKKWVNENAEEFDKKYSE